MGIRSAVSQPLESRIPFVDSRIPSVSQQWYRDGGEPSSSMEIGLPVKGDAANAELFLVFWGLSSSLRLSQNGHISMLSLQMSVAIRPKTGTCIYNPLYGKM